MADTMKTSALTHHARIFTNRAKECGEGACRFPQRPVRELLETCTLATDVCAGGGICTGPPGGFTRCVHDCVTTSDCPSGSRCEGSQDSRRFCRPPALLFVNPTLPLVDEVIGPAAPSGCSTSAGSIVLGLAMLLLRRRRFDG